MFMVFKTVTSRGRTETLLWSNPKPTASFSNQTVTLSQSIDDFGFMRLDYCFSGGQQSNKTESI